MYTKYTIVTFAKPKESFEDWNDNEVNFINDAFDKAVILTSQGKTPGYHEPVGPGQIKRLWINLEAAEEWRQFIFDNAVKYSISIDNIEICDNLDS